VSDGSLSAAHNHSLPDRHAAGGTQLTLDWDAELGGDDCAATLQRAEQALKLLMGEPENLWANRCAASVNFREQTQVPARRDTVPQLPMRNRALANVEVVG
jgi:hypothetical protein